MKITSIEIARLQIPLIRPFITAIRRTEQVDDVIVIIHTIDGKRGYGSAAATPAITGDSHDSIVTAIKDTLAPQLLGKEVEDFSNLLMLIEQALPKNTSAKAAMDIALHDLFAQYCGQPLYQLLGSKDNKINTCVTVSVQDAEGMVEEALSLIDIGYKTLKIKLGKGAAEDLKRIQAIRQAVGNHIVLLADANQGWDYQDAVQVIKEFELQGLNVNFIEQPVQAPELVALKRVQQQVHVCIIADESCFSPNDALEIAKSAACKAVNIKLMKCGGLANANAIYSITKAASIKAMVGCMLESPIGIAAMASFALSKPDILLADLDAIVLIRENYVKGGAQLIGTTIQLPDKPGLGIEGFVQGINLIAKVD
jgi:o-succinylbenzoate synthase